MRIVIDMDEKVYNDFKDAYKRGYCGRMIDLDIIINGTPLPKGHERLIDADKVKKDIIDWFMYTVNSKHNSIPKDCDELIKYITGWVTYAIDKTPTIIEVDE